MDIDKSILQLALMFKVGAGTGQDEWISRRTLFRSLAKYKATNNSWDLRSGDVRMMSGSQAVTSPEPLWLPLKEQYKKTGPGDETPRGFQIRHFAPQGTCTK